MVEQAIRSRLQAEGFEEISVQLSAQTLTFSVRDPQTGQTYQHQIHGCNEHSYDSLPGIVAGWAISQRTTALAA